MSGKFSKDMLPIFALLKKSGKVSNAFEICKFSRALLLFFKPYNLNILNFQKYFCDFENCNLVLFSANLIYIACPKNDCHLFRTVPQSNQTEFNLT